MYHVKSTVSLYIVLCHYIKSTGNETYEKINKNQKEIVQDNLRIQYTSQTFLWK